jgi:hypothetical protein
MKSMKNSKVIYKKGRNGGGDGLGQIQKMEVEGSEGYIYRRSKANG